MKRPMRHLSRAVARLVAIAAASFALAGPALAQVSVSIPSSDLSRGPAFVNEPE